ncbi:MAG: MFS transporter [Pseudomonadales bacterium]
MAQPGLRWYLASSASFMVPGGIQQVLFPFLVVVLLAESADRVGIAQMSAQLPALFLVLFGGVLGDRVDQRRILLVVHLVAALPALAMSGLVAGELLSYPALIVYALVGGVLGSISQPARDALLNRVAGAEIQRTVILVMTLQWTVQLVGLGIASLADRVGAVPLLLVQGVVMASGALAIWRIRIPPMPARTIRRHAGADILDGLRIVFRSPVLAPAVVLNAAVGMFFAGGYMVLLPLFVRDVYGGAAADIALTFAANMLGTLGTSLWLLRRGSVRRPGRAVMLALATGCVSFGALYFELPLPAFYLLIFLWGVGGGFTMNLLRSIVQQASPETHRARVLSVLSLGMMGGMPIGSLMIGYAAHTLGVQNAVLVPVAGVALVTTLVALRSDFARHE